MLAGLLFIEHLQLSLAVLLNHSETDAPLLNEPRVMLFSCSSVTGALAVGPEQHDAGHTTQFR
jgi:hypothetical protein